MLPLSRIAFQVYLYSFCLGIFSAVNDTGCNIMMRELHGKKAGPWLGANGISFGMSAAVIPLVEVLTSDLTEQFHTLAVLVLIIAAMMMFGLNEKESLGEHEQLAIQQKESELDELVRKHPMKDSLVPHYQVEMGVALMLFCLVGGQVDTVAYMASYLEQTAVIALPHRSRVLLIFWSLVSVGRFIGLIDQRFLTDESLVHHIRMLRCRGVSAAASDLPQLQRTRSLAVRGSLRTALRPHRGVLPRPEQPLTLLTEKSTSIVMLGINCGASFVPLVTSHVWESYRSPLILTVFMFLSMLLPLPLVLISSRLSYETKLPEFDAQRPLTFFEYHSLSTRRFRAAADALIAVRRLSLLSRRCREESQTYSATDNPVA